MRPSTYRGNAAWAANLRPTLVLRGNTHKDRGAIITYQVTILDTMYCQNPARFKEGANKSLI